MPRAEERWRDAGLPFIRTYKASEYGGAHQVWHITQDRRGVMYFAIRGCVLEYNGVSWRQIYTGESMSVQMVKTRHNRAYLGGCI